MADRKLTTNKIQSFTQGFQTKNQFQKTQQERLRKQKEEEDMAAAIYEDFVKSFEVEESDKKTKTFLRGGTFNQETKTTIAPDLNAKEYKPTLKFGVTSAPTKPNAVSQSKVSSLFAEEEKPANPTPPPEKEETKKKRGMDAFIEEMKNLEQQAKEKKLKPDGTPVVPDPAASGSYDTGDPTTTNLYVGNVNPNITEEMLYNEFRQFGEIASIKIMWPRTEEEHKRARNCAFVAFMKRDDADAAREELNNYNLMGMEIRVGWGKAVPLPSTPIEPHMVSKIIGQTGPPPAQPTVTAGAQSHNVLVKFPMNPEVLRIINTLAPFVATEGYAFERVIMEREKDNPLFQFMFAHKTEENNYYRWKVYSLLQVHREFNKNL